MTKEPKEQGLPKELIIKDEHGNILPFSVALTGSTTTLTIASTTLPIHRQSRSHLKTTARLVGRDTDGERSLFDLPRYVEDANPLKRTISKNTAITGQLLIALWQRDKDEKGVYTIKNLTDLSRVIGVTPQEIKIYLLYLGGFQYPVVKLGEPNKNGRRILSLYHEKLFYIKFNFLLNPGETEKSFTSDDKIGTNYLSFIRDRDIESVEVMPSPTYKAEIESKENTLGNILVDDSFVAFSLGLSDLAYKIFCFSGSNRPHFHITFDKLIAERHINLEKQVHGEKNKAGKLIRKGQGKARVLQRIKEALAELVEKGHLTSWEYCDNKDAFKWTYSDKIFRHKELLPEQGDQTGQDGTGSL